MKTIMTLETALRRIESFCRENEMAFGPSYKPCWRGGKGAPMRGAMAEARGVVDTCHDVKILCRKLRREGKRK